MSETMTEQASCGSNGPRIGSDGTPICMLPKLHEGRHEPHESWKPTIMSWSDHAFAGVDNAALARPAGPAERFVSTVITVEIETTKRTARETFEGNDAMERLQDWLDDLRLGFDR